MPQMQRQQILVDDARKRRVEALSKELNISVSEVYRRAVDQFDAGFDLTGNEEKELKQLLNVLRETNSRVDRAIHTAEKKVNDALEFLNARRHKRLNEASNRHADPSTTSRST